MQDSVRSGNFTFIHTPIDGVIVVEPKCYGGSRLFSNEVFLHPSFDEWLEGARS